MATNSKSVITCPRCGKADKILLPPVFPDFDEFADEKEVARVKSDIIRKAGPKYVSEPFCDRCLSYVAAGP